MEEKKMKKQQYIEIKGERIELENNMQIEESNCLDCKIKLIKQKEDKNLFDGAVVFHFTKLKCPQCKKEYLDMKEAKKYDLFLKLRKMGKEQALTRITENKTKEIYV